MKWVEVTQDFEDPELTEQLTAFIKVEQHTAPNMYFMKSLKRLEALVGIMHLLQINFSKKEASRGIGERVLVSRGSFSSHKRGNVTFMDIEPEHFADQLTLTEYSLMKNIRHHEFVKQAWIKKDAEAKSPNILKYIEWFNQVLFTMKYLTFADHTLVFH
jgi:hypothetical protein